MSAPSRFVLLVLALQACSDRTSLLENAPCPCVEGFVCCRALELCVASKDQCPRFPVVPKIDRVVPARGPLLGGTRLTVEGENFVEGLWVTIGGRVCDEVSLEGASRLECTSPEGRSEIPLSDVTVHTLDGGSATLQGAFRYQTPLFIERESAFHTNDRSVWSVSVFDLDLDGQLDLFFSDINLSGATFYRNEGGMRFSDSTARYGESLPKTTMGLPGDFTNDGAEDLLLIARISAVDAGAPYLTLLSRDASGALRSTNPGFLSAETGRIAHASVLDLDRDGDLDLIGCKSAQVDGPHLFIGLNDGQGSFRDAAERSHPQPRPETTGCDGLSLGDYDDDGDLDVITCGGTHLNLFENRDGHLHEVTEEVGLPMEPLAGKTCASVAVIDFDMDGDLDISYTPSTNLEDIRSRAGVLIFENEAQRFSLAAAQVAPFENAPCPLQIELADAALPGGGESTAWADFDHDGDLDAFVPSPYSGCGLEPWIFENRAAQNEAGFRIEPIEVREALSNTTGIITEDLDNDGDLDIVNGTWGPGFQTLLENKLVRTATQAHYLRVQPITDPDGDASDADADDDRVAWGVRIDVDLDGPAQAPDFAPGFQKLLTTTFAAWDAGNANGPSAHFGLGARTASVHVRVIFADGSQVMQRVERFDQTIVIKDDATSP